MPILDGEAVDTDRAINRIEPWLREVLRARYLGIGPTGQRLESDKDAAVARRLGVSVRTYYRRLDDARHRLGDELVAALRVSDVHRGPVRHAV